VFAVTKLDRLAQSVAGLGSAGRALRPSSLRQAAGRRAASCASTAHVGCTPNPSGEHLAGGDRIELSVPGHDEFYWAPCRERSGGRLSPISSAQRTNPWNPSRIGFAFLALLGGFWEPAVQLSNSKHDDQADSTAQFLDWHKPGFLTCRGRKICRRASTHRRRSAHLLSAFRGPYLWLEGSNERRG
jgi:hypothetical protein